MQRADHLVDLLGAAPRRSRRRRPAPQRPAAPGRCRRTAATAARIVEPVARPSSTTITTRPATASGAGRRGRSAARRPEFGELTSRHRVERRPSMTCSPAMTGSLRDHLDDVAHRRDGAHRQLRLAGRTELADDQHIEHGAQRLGHLGGHRHPAPRQAQHDHIVAAGIAGRAARQRPGPRPPGRRTGPGWSAGSRPVKSAGRRVQYR